MKLIFDCNNIGYISAFSHQNLSYKGKPTGVIYGMFRQILANFEKFTPSQLIFCWDSKKSYRKMIYSDYKANRKKKSADFDYDAIFSQFDFVRREILSELGFKNVFYQNGYEADDLIAWIVNRFPDEYVIISTDEDLWQLIQKERRGVCVNVYNPIKKTLLTFKEFYASFGIEPSKWSEVKAIAGCSTDNVAGIKGVGENTAIKFITDSLSQSSKKYLSIVEGEDIIRRNRRLVMLPFSGPVPIRITGLVDDEIKKDRFQSVFVRFGFNSFLSGEMVDRWDDMIVSLMSMD